MLKRFVATMVMACLITLALVSSAFAAPDPNNSSTWIYSFGSTPLSDILSQAQTAKSQTGVTISAEELAALALAVTYPETQGGTSKTRSTIVRGDQGTLSPSPMTMGRSDLVKLRADNVYLFSSDIQTTQYPRAYWHAGVGAWQLDGIGMGRFLMANERISTWTGGGKAVNTIASLYRYAETHSSSYPTPESKRTYAWAQWAACSDVTYNIKCEDVYQLIYSPSYNKVMVVGDAAVDRMGGAITTTCHGFWTVSYISCTLIDPTLAQGAREGQMWYTSPDGIWSNGVNTKSPLAHPFYVASDGTYEYRQWRNEPAKDPGLYPSTHMVGRRVYVGDNTTAQDDRVPNKWTKAEWIWP